MTQTWHRVLFAHWTVPPAVVRAHVPALPGLSAFPEINVRTYVTLAGKPGVYFFSLDAANALAVWARGPSFT